ncbi:MAG: hypothetical protein HN580_16670 [Deltaproteobacteria bacterium]|nr:hypothetical protein [Deltaproteobacteria bacterium]MBT6615018.1 hypothetical protein [Deltaproteobacteria bacterium]MBT7890653.1 hypothetical protein [Deltaproteobacteria bacterium]
MTQNMIEKDHQNRKPHNRIMGWAALFFCIFLLWGFTFYLVPWMQGNIPMLGRLAEVVRERDIDTTAFFYSENKESYEAERYLNETLELAKPRGYGFDRYFALGILLCFIILVIGYRFLPNGTNPEPDN